MALDPEQSASAMPHTDPSIAQNERFRTSFDLAPIGMAHIGLDGRCLLVNDQMCVILGYTREQLLARTAQDITHPSDLNADQALAMQQLAGEINSYSIEKRYIRHDGTTLWAKLTSALARKADGSPEFFIAMLEDISERVQAASVLAQGQVQLAGIIESAMDAIITVDDSQRIVRWNAAASQMFRCTADEAIGQPIDRFIPTRFRDAHHQHMALFARTGDTARAMGHQRALAALRYDNTEFPIEASISRVIVNGQPIFSVILRDITERLAVEQALRESEARFATAFRASPVPMVISILADGRIVDANDRFLALFGTQLDAIRNQPSQSLDMWADPHDRDRALALLRRNGVLRDLEIPVRAGDGSIRQVLLSVEPLSLAGEACILTALYDITERVQSEAALAQQAATLREQAHLLDLAFDAILVHDLASERITFWNAGAAALYGWSESDALGNRLHALLQTRFPIAHSEIMVRLQRDGQWRGELVHQPRAGGELVVDSWWVLRGDPGSHSSVLEINRDITERKQLEAQLQQSQKMESIGQLAGGIAHDFNNLLTAIIGYADLVADTLPRDDSLQAEVREIRKAGSRAAQLTRQLLTFARRQPMSAQVLDLNEQIMDISGLLRRLISENIELNIMSTPDLAPVWGDAGQLQQVLINLAVNARDAMPAGGTLTIETANVDLDPRYARGHLDVEAGRYVMVAVSDTGKGMPPDVQSHIFEPFFTTKPPGEGTGLGLSTCYGIIKQHGGTIWIYSELGLGTVAKVYLPCHEDSAAVPHAATVEQLEQLPRGSETVLLAEDEDAVRTLAARLLRSCGYRVIEAPNGAAALHVAEMHQPELIHLLLTDVVMPELGGPAAAMRIRQWYPDIKVLYMSGYPGHATIQNAQVAAGSNLLQKPFTAMTLAQAVRAVLD